MCGGVKPNGVHLAIRLQATGEASRSPYAAFFRAGAFFAAVFFAAGFFAAAFFGAAFFAGAFFAAPPPEAEPLPVRRREALPAPAAAKR